MSPTATTALAEPGAALRVFFREEQRKEGRLCLHLAVTAFAGCLFLFVFHQARPFGEGFTPFRFAAFVFIALVSAAFVAYKSFARKLTTQVDAQGILIWDSFAGSQPVEMPHSGVVSRSVVTASSVGLPTSFWDKLRRPSFSSYWLDSPCGVLLHYPGGLRVFVGSQTPDRLEKAIAAAIQSAGETNTATVAPAPILQECQTARRVYFHEEIRATRGQAMWAGALQSAMLLIATLVAGFVNGTQELFGDKWRWDVAAFLTAGIAGTVVARGSRYTIQVNDYGVMVKAQAVLGNWVEIPLAGLVRHYPTDHEGFKAAREQMDGPWWKRKVAQHGFEYGKKGVLLVFADNRLVFLGSRRPLDLDAAVAEFLLRSRHATEGA